MKTMDFAQAITAAFKAKFPQGYAEFSRASFGGGIHFRMGLIGDKKDWAYGIQQNDQLSLVFIVRDVDLTGEIDNAEKIVTDFADSRLSCLPQDNYHVMSSHKIAARKINNTAQKTIDNLKKLFERVHAEVSEQAKANNIYKQESIEKYLP